MSNCKICGKWAGAHATLPGQSTDHLCHGHPMTNPSHTELAAQARKAANALEILDLDSTADLLRQCAAALESPEQVLGLGWKRCGACNGTGDSPSGMLACEDCSGSGRVAAPTPPTAPAQDAQGDAVRTQLEWFALAAHWYINASDRELAEQGQERVDALKQVHLLSGHLEASGFKFATPSPPAERVPLSDEQIEKLRDATFSINNPFCPVDSKSMRKAVRAAERAHGIVTKEST